MFEVSALHVVGIFLFVLGSLCVIAGWREFLNNETFGGYLGNIVGCIFLFFSLVSFGVIKVVL